MKKVLYDEEDMTVSMGQEDDDSFHVKISLEYAEIVITGAIENNRIKELQVWE